MTQKQNHNQNEVLPLRDQEIQLIKLIREKYRFGTIEIITRDGVPIDILRTVERERLS